MKSPTTGYWLAGPAHSHAGVPCSSNVTRTRPAPILSDKRLSLALISNGGGIRGKSSLLILENIMERIRDSEGLDQVPRPCEYFDLIGGTSTGGIIAIMLGRLGMTVDECIRAYENVGRAAFTPKLTLLPFAPPKGAFSATALEAAVKKVVKDNCTEAQCVTQRRQGQPTVDTCPHEDLGFRDTTCTKTVVLAITKANVDARPTLFTTYDPSMAFQDCTIWQVARATSAATTFFKSIELGRDKIEFIDAGFGYNNPCEVLIEEAEKQFPDRRQLQILSIGTGLGDVVEIKNTRKSILTALKKMASSSTAVADRLVDRYSDKVPYFRFNVSRGLEDITLSDWQKTSKISAHTRNYLRGNERAIQKFVDGLLFGPGRQQSDILEFSGSTSICVHYSIPFFQNTKFTGREGVLKILQKKLFRSQDCRTVAIVGLGGVGKTQVVLQFAYWVKQNQPDYSIFWVPAYAEESFEKAYLDIAKIIGIEIDSAKEDPKMTVRNHLSSEGMGRWLLIIDNADDQETISGPSSIYDYLPMSHNGLTVFTTRLSELAQSVAGANQIELHKMDDQEARHLLENSVVQDSVVHKQLRQDTTLTMELLNELTCLPLAITQAAAYLNQNLKHHYSPVKRYLELLRNTEDDMVRLMSAKFYDHTRYQDSQNAVATTWLVSFEQIRAKDPIAAELLSFVSYIEPKAIPRSLLPKLGSDVEMETAMGTLSGYAFLESRGVDDTYDMHSLVHLATRVWVQQQAPSENSYTAIDAVKHFSAIFPGPESANRQKWQVYFPHAFRLLSRNTAPEIEERYDLSFYVGLCLCEDRRFKEAPRQNLFLVPSFESYRLFIMARKFFVGGNFKMNGTISSVTEIVDNLNKAQLDSNVETVIAPPALYLLLVREHAKKEIGVAAQNVYDKPNGAFTGEISLWKWFSNGSWKEDMIRCSSAPEKSLGDLSVVKYFSNSARPGKKAAMEGEDDYSPVAQHLLDLGKQRCLLVIVVGFHELVPGQGVTDEVDLVNVFDVWGLLIDGVVATENRVVE
ncbi:hypothetical protein NUW58_g3700 [Xylaria curta]|uniref:Uncharacterized protein n=1 Tax=Xylaria curta TaxID=42375 RepID=A0ACC1PAZ5_9PEZI|nr:hypothetical protein NUW58_g3700 [Xylaria curta]